MALPINLEIQLVNKNGQINPLENVFFGLKIYVSDSFWANVNFMKTDFLGKISLNKDEILQHAGIQEYAESLNKSLATKIELLAYEGEFLEDLISKIGQVLKSYGNQEKIKDDLFRYGFEDKNKNTENLINKAFTNDQNLFNFLKFQKNSFFKINNNIIEDIWTDDGRRKYQFIIE
jgi:hypothetical protein